MPKYLVRYKVVYEGYASVEANDIYEAKELVAEGEFEEDKKGQQRVDWEAVGQAVLVPEPSE